MKSLQSQFDTYMDRHELNDHFSQMMHDIVRDPEIKQFWNQNKNQLNPDALQRSASHLYEYVRERDKIAKGQTPLIPGYVPHLVISDGLIDVSYEPSQQQQIKTRVQTVKNRVQRLNMPKDIENASFKDYYPSKGRENALAAAMEFVKAFVEAPTKFHKGLYLYGAFGVGKTYLIGAIANNLAQQGYTSLLVHFPTYAVELKNAIGSNTVMPKVNHVKNAPILMIDDIGADTSNAWIRDDILGVILQYRMQEQLPTFFTSNLSMKNLQEYLTNTTTGSDKIKAERIMERVRYLSKEITVAGENRRQEN